MKTKKTAAKQKQYGKFSILITFLVFLFLIGINILVDYLADQKSLFIDLTSEKIYGISEETIQTIKNLEQNVEIIVLEDRTTMESSNEYASQVYHTLQQYPKYSDRITLSFVDLVENPTFIQQFPDYELNSGDTVITSSDFTKVLPLKDMFSYDTSGYKSSVKSSKAEQSVTNAISYVTSGKTVKTVILEGFSDTTPDGLTSLITEGNGQVAAQSLLTEDIDPNADIAILYDTRRDLDESALAKLDTWLDNNGKKGKTLLVFSNPYYTDLDRLNSFLNEWNLQIENGLAVETQQQNYYNVFYCPIAQYGESQITENLKDTTAPTIMMLTSPLKAFSETDSLHKITPVLTFSESAAVLPLDAEDKKDAQPAAGTAGMLLSASAPSDITNETSRILLSGSTECISSAILQDSTFSNRKLFHQVFEFLGDAPPVIEVPAKDLTEIAHTMPQSQVIAYIVIFLLLIPAGILITGITIWIRRKNG